MSTTREPLCLDLGGRPIGDGQPCFIIAEIGSNHNQDFDLALRMIDAAAQSGVDAVKFQTFRASSHYSKHAPGFGYLNNVNTHELIRSLELNRSWQADLKRHSGTLFGPRHAKGDPRAVFYRSKNLAGRPRPVKTARLTC